MGGKKAKQKTLLSSSFWPMLERTSSAVGKFVSTPGRFWENCPAADRDKRYMCVVVEFKAVHDYGGGRKGAGFLLKLVFYRVRAEANLDDRIDVPRRVFSDRNLVDAHRLALFA